MHPLVPLGLLTLALVAGLTWRMGRRQERLPPRTVGLLLAAGLPLSALVNVAAKKPLSVLVSDASGISQTLTPSHPLWYLGFALLLAPVTEELIKLLPVLLVARRIRDADSLVGAGMAAGLAFGVGEVLFLGGRLIHRGEYADLPWYSFTGFLSERLLAVLVHGALTALLVYCWRVRRWPLWLAALPSIGGHALVNLFPLLAMAKILTGTPAMLTAAIVPVLVLLPLLVILARLRGGSARETPPSELLWRSRNVDG